MGSSPNNRARDAPPAAAEAPDFAKAMCRMGPLTLDPCGEVVMREAAPLPLGRRAVALLLRLVQQPGQVVTKDEMIEAGWHGLCVEESNLTTQIFQLRRALKRETGKDWIETLPRRGYRFVGPAIWQEKAPTAGLAHSLDGPTGLPCVAVLPLAARDPALAPSPTA